jgi:hypothetical protein
MERQQSSYIWIIALVKTRIILWFGTSNVDTCNYFRGSENGNNRNVHSEIWYLYLYTAFLEIAIINLLFWLDIWLKIAIINACNDLWIYSRWCTPYCCARLIFYFDLNYFWGFQRYHINLVGHIIKKRGYPLMSSCLLLFYFCTAG